MFHGSPAIDHEGDIVNNVRVDVIHASTQDRQENIPVQLSTYQILTRYEKAGATIMQERLGTIQL